MFNEIVIFKDEFLKSNKISSSRKFFEAKINKNNKFLYNMDLAFIKNYIPKIKINK